LRKQVKNTAKIRTLGIGNKKLPGLVSQSVLLWDGVRLEMKRALKWHIKINLHSQRLPVDDAPLYAAMY
jgi:hypothetical protein